MVRSFFLLAALSGSFGSVPEKAEPAPAGETVLLLMELRVSPPVANGLTVRRKRALGLAVSSNR